MTSWSGNYVTTLEWHVKSSNIHVFSISTNFKVEATLIVLPLQNRVAFDLRLANYCHPCSKYLYLRQAFPSAWKRILTTCRRHAHKMRVGASACFAHARVEWRLVRSLRSWAVLGMYLVFQHVLLLRNRKSLRLIQTMCSSHVRARAVYLRKWDDVTNKSCNY